VPLHRNISGAVSARKLLKPSKYSASLRVCNEKKNFWFWVLDFGFFVSDFINGIVSGLFDPLHLALGLNC